MPKSSKLSRHVYGTTTPGVSDGKRQHLQNRIYLDNLFIFKKRWAEP